MKDIWWERHRPITLDGFVGQDHLMAEMQQVVAGNADPQHYIFHSREPGTGKTTLAFILAAAVGKEVHVFNASTKEQRGIGFIQNDIIPLATIHPDILILLDEADQLTPDAQSALKGVIENGLATFILTCNDLNKVTPWLQSRCQVRIFQPIPQDVMRTRLVTICESEGVEDITPADITNIVTRHDGDLRNAIGALQTLSLLPTDDRRAFSNSLREPEFDANRFLRLAFKDRAFDEALDMTKGYDAISVIHSVFIHGTNSPASPEAKLRLIDAAITSRRDLLLGVEEVFVTHNFVRLLVEAESI
jgi:DNA polymerase III delta prime subunit